MELKYILDLDERLKQERNHKSNNIYNKATPKCEETLHFSKVEKTKAVVETYMLAVTTVAEIARPVKWFVEDAQPGA